MARLSATKWTVTSSGASSRADFGKWIPAAVRFGRRFAPQKLSPGWKTGWSKTKAPRKRGFYFCIQKKDITRRASGQLENRIEQLEEEVKRLKEELNKQVEYFKPKDCEKYYYILSKGDVNWSPWHDEVDDFDRKHFEVANCFETEEEARKVAFEQTLFRKIRRFKETYDEGDIDWNKENSPKFYIVFDNQYKKILVKYICTCEDFGQIYFNSHKIAEQCIEEFKEDLKKYFTGNY